MTRLNEYFGYLDKVDKRVRNERVTNLLPEFGLARREDFHGTPNTVPAQIKEIKARLDAIAKEEQFRSVETHFEEEHELWEVRFVNSQGVPHSIGWQLVSSPEYKAMMKLHAQIHEYLQPPFVVEWVQSREPVKEQNGEAVSEAEQADASGFSFYCGWPNVSV